MIEHYPTMKTKFQSGRHSIALFLLGLSTLANPLLKADEPVKAEGNAAPQAVEETLNNGTVVELIKLGLGEALVIDKIRASRCDFDVSINGIRQLKSASVADAIISAMLAAPKRASGPSNESPGDSNDPKLLHDAGIYYYDDSDGTAKMTKSEPSVYTQQKTGVMFFPGQTVKMKAILRPATAMMRSASRKPVFYFYFENTKSSLGESRNTATSPNEFVLAQFECKEKDNLRSLVVGQINAYAGTQFGPEDKAIRGFDYEKLAPGSYKVCPKQDLANGEYGFFYGGNSTGGGGKVFDFAVQGSPDTEPPSTADKKGKVKVAKD